MEMQETPEAVTRRSRMMEMQETLEAVTRRSRTTEIPEMPGTRAAVRRRRLTETQETTTALPEAYPQIRPLRLEMRLRWQECWL